MGERRPQRDSTDTRPGSPDSGDAEVPLHVEIPSQVLAYRCTRSGDCCRGWSVTADTEFRDTLDDLLAPSDENVTGSALASGRILQAPIADSVQREAMLVTRGGACVFLEGGRHCELHRSFGPATKPRACRSFPIRQVWLGDHLSLSLDPSCRRAAELLDRPFPPGLVHDARPAPRAEMPGTELIDGLTIDTELFFIIETALLRSLEMTNVDLEERLVVGSLLLDEVMSDADLEPDDGTSPAAWRWRAELEDRPDGRLRELLRRARASRPHPTRQYLLIARLLELVEQWHVLHEADQTDRFWTTTRCVRELFDLDAETVGWDERAARFDDRLGRIWSARTPDVDRILANYVWHALLARHLSIEHGLVAGYRIQLLHYVLARLHVAGIAYRKGETPDGRHAIQAVQTVERVFGHLPLLKRFWKRTSSINLLTDAGLVPQILPGPDASAWEADEDDREHAA